MIVSQGTPQQPCVAADHGSDWSRLGESEDPDGAVAALSARADRDGAVGSDHDGRGVEHGNFSGHRQAFVGNEGNCLSAAGAAERRYRRRQMDLVELECVGRGNRGDCELWGRVKPREALGRGAEGFGSAPSCASWSYGGKRVHASVMAGRPSTLRHGADERLRSSPSAHFCEGRAGICRLVARTGCFARWGAAADRVFAPCCLAGMGGGERQAVAAEQGCLAPAAELRFGRRRAVCTGRATCLSGWRNIAKGRTP